MKWKRIATTVINVKRYEGRNITTMMTMVIITAILHQTPTLRTTFQSVIQNVNNIFHIHIRIRTRFHTLIQFLTKFIKIRSKSHSIQWLKRFKKLFLLNFYRFDMTFLTTFKMIWHFILSNHLLKIQVNFNVHLLFTLN